jgi:N-acetylglucosaminyldiphosphoundecaprenol N-acetyl-beta-D-mannosaminyltransferase
MLDFTLGPIRSRTATTAELLETIAAWCSTPDRPARLVACVNPHIFNEGVAHPEVVACLNRCAFVTLDGVGVSFPASLLNRSNLPRVVMYQLFDAALPRADIRGDAIVVGLREEQNQAARRRIAGLSAGIRVVGGAHGYLGDAEYAKVFEQHADVDFVLVGMGTPRSERILLQAAQRCRRAICWHIGGGTLKALAGVKRNPAPLISALGLEWVHRLLLEPETRRRYLIGIPAFAVNLLSALRKDSRRSR